MLVLTFRQPLLPLLSKWPVAHHAVALKVHVKVHTYTSFVVDNFIETIRVEYEKRVTGGDYFRKL